MDLKSGLIDAAYAGSRAMARIQQRFRRQRRAVIVPPAGEGSLGDAAMLNATCATLKALGLAEVDLLLKPGWGAIEGFDRRADGNAHFYGGGRRTFLPILRSLGRYSHAYFIGADVADGVYNPLSVRRRLSVLAEAAAMGGKATVLGCSFSETPDAGCVAALSALPSSVEIKARDPVSKARMEAVLDRPIDLVADLAFLLPPRPEAPKAVDAATWIKARRSAGDRVVAVNANYLIDARHAGFSAALGPLLKRLLAQDISLLLVPHDTRTDRSDQVILREAAAHVAADAADRVRFLEPEEPAMIKAALGAVDLVVTGRMHVAILATGAGRPALSFGYQGKFEGLYQMLGLADAGLLVSPSMLTDDPASVVGAVCRHLAAAEALSGHISAALPAVRELALANFSGLR
jgi:polysaccharide pyruvyl transferase WcaK-like protein